MKILLRRLSRIADISKIWHTAGQKVFLKKLLNRLLRRYGTVQLYKLSKRERKMCIRDSLVPASANSYLIAPAQQFKVGDVLKDEIDIPCICLLYTS